MKFIFIAIFIHYVFGLQKCATTADTFCVTGTSDGNTTTFTIHAKGEWGGFGVGDSMANSFIYVGFKKPDGNYNVISSVSKSRALPSISSNQVAKIIPLAVAAPSWAKTSFSFTLPHKTSVNGELTPLSNYIWATGNGVTNADKVSASYAKHTDKGIFNGLDFVSQSGASNVFANFAPIALGLLLMV